MGQHSARRGGFAGGAGGALAEQFVAAVFPRTGHTPKHRIDDEEYAAFVQRAIRGLEARAIENPFLLPLVRELEDRMREVQNVVIATNADRYEVDPRRGASLGEVSRLLGMSKQSVSERRAKGRASMLARIASAGVARFSEARREREVRERAVDTAVVALADFRARRAS